MISWAVLRGTAYEKPRGYLGLQRMAEAAKAGLPVTKAAVRETVTLIREQVRVGRGLPARQTRRLEHETTGTNAPEDGGAAKPVTRNGGEWATEETVETHPVPAGNRDAPERDRA